ncbi:MAG: hypothetical protein JJE52_10865, partial [Acidimicrobiia bacterium]|nr:hypothetical protein [Acidimicrobiia bacterium]
LKVVFEQAKKEGSKIFSKERFARFNRESDRTPAAPKQTASKQTAPKKAGGKATPAAAAKKPTKPKAGKKGAAAERRLDEVQPPLGREPSNGLGDGLGDIGGGAEPTHGDDVVEHWPARGIVRLSGSQVGHVSGWTGQLEHRPLERSDQRRTATVELNAHVVDRPEIEHATERARQGGAEHAGKRGHHVTLTGPTWCHGGPDL